MEMSHRYVSRGIHTKSSSGNSLQSSFHKPSKENQTLKRSTSQKDFFHSRDSSSVSTYVFFTFRGLKLDKILNSFILIKKVVL
jgi:type IV secretory pathway TrbL component